MKSANQLLDDLANCLSKLRNEREELEIFVQQQLNVDEDLNYTHNWDKAQQLVEKLRRQMERKNVK